MDIFTIDRDYTIQEVVDKYESLIWTERYKGDGDFELVVPLNSSILSKLPRGQILLCEGSDELMILETREIQNGVMKTTGITLTQWLNNRIIRTTSDRTKKEWYLTGFTPGHLITHIVQMMCIDSDYIDGTIDIGIPTLQVVKFKIPGMFVNSYDNSGSNIEISIPFAPVYDTIRQIADTYDIGMKLVYNPDSGLPLWFSSYKGIDRTSDQSAVPVIQFSADMDSLANILDLQSITDHKNYVYIFNSSADPGTFTAVNPGVAIADSANEGFDIRVLQEFADDIDTAPLAGSSVLLSNLLTQKAALEMGNRKKADVVDGEIVNTGQFVYGQDYFLGDIVEVKGNTGILQSARITEYIRSKDKTGTRAYPTLSMVE